MMASPMIIIDGGGTSTTVAAFHSGTVVRTEWGSFKPDEDSNRTDELCRSLGSWLVASAIDPAFAGLVLVGMAGIWSTEEKRQYASAMGDAWEEYIGAEVPRIVVLSDVELVQLAALGSDPGIVVIAGTGTIAVGVSSGGHSFRVGGWGPRIDDAGGGFWMGREALRAVACMLDGRGPDTLLLRPVAAWLRVDPQHPHAIHNRLRTTSITGAARLARAVLTYAAEGDAVAASIRAAAAAELAKLIVTARRAEPLPIRLYGSLWADEDYRALVMERVDEEVGPNDWSVVDDVVERAAERLRSAGSV
jgi:glucosamine kinase